MRSRVLGATSVLPFSTFDTVARDTPVSPPMLDNVPALGPAAARGDLARSGTPAFLVDLAGMATSVARPGKPLCFRKISRQNSIDTGMTDKNTGRSTGKFSKMYRE